MRSVNMKVNNSDFGGFIVSKNVVAGKPIRYTFREKSAVPQLNGWTIYSLEDDDEYVNDSSNFQVLGANSILEIAPVMLEIFDAPYGTDLCWLYKEGVHVGFYDLISEDEKDIGQIVKGN
ncbi:hypothetical protein COL11_00775 [Bacillus anthracis]|nr:hypothetical protein CN394_10430 [Bacillus anthracis]PFF07494.1 hypothetical protein CN315_16540 [Bacillus cereus]PEZ25278.1 hypothetical protein CN337_06300 [Bacillus anthracis]PEZ79869.1 hypothetical protein CN410_01890 [Bacillus anthracis]PFW40032.1 hypothetical protein COL11_00775 [Bacillus anthracis]